MTEVVEPTDLHVREVALASKLLVSATSAEAARKELGLPKHVTGLTIVDLAAGACPLTATLLEEGANAYAFDRIYKDRSELVKAVQNNWLPISLLYARQRGPTYRATIEQIYKKAIGKFLRSFDKRPDRYIEGWLTQLPFSDNFSDFTVSRSGIGDLFEDIELLQQVTMEAIRVTKPGGVVLIVPFLTNGGSSGIGGRITRIHNTLADFLTEQKVGKVTIEREATLFHDSRLRIVKAS